MSNIQKYAKVRALMADLEKQRRELEPLVVEELKSIDKKVDDTEFGKVGYSVGYKYTFSSSLQAKEKEAKEKAALILEPIAILKEDEKGQKIAKAEETFSVSFKPTK